MALTLKSRECPCSWNHKNASMKCPPALTFGLSTQWCPSLPCTYICRTLGKHGIIEWMFRILKLNTVYLPVLNFTSCKTEQLAFALFTQSQCPDRDNDWSYRLTLCPGLYHFLRSWNNVLRFFSSPVLMDRGLLCITFHLSWCLLLDQIDWIKRLN